MTRPGGRLDRREGSRMEFGHLQAQRMPPGEKILSFLGMRQTQGAEWSQNKHGKPKAKALQGWRMV